MKKFNPLLILILFIFFILSSALLLDDPFVWPDEALYGDIARNIALENRLGTNLLQGLITGIENHAYWLPPLYMYILAFWSKIFSFSLINIKLMSIFFSAIVLVLFFYISKLLAPQNNKFKPFPPIFITLALAINPAFLKASRLARPEIVALTFVLFALLFYLKFLKKQSLLLISITGLFLGLALVTHLITICFALAFTTHLLYLLLKKQIHLITSTVFLLSIFAPIAIWLISIFPNYNLLINQLNIISESRSYTIPWYINVLSFSLLIKFSYIIYITTTLFFLIYTILKRTLIPILFSLILISTWIFITLGEIFWYTIYPITFSYLALVYLTYKTFNNRTSLILILSILLTFLITGFSDFSNSFQIYKKNHAYFEFESQIKQNIPPQKSVFLSSIPDAYFAFDKTQNTLYEYPAFFANPNDFKQMLDKTDYIIFNHFFSPDPISQVLDKYMTDNTESIKQLNNPYQIMIIKLKNREQRI